MNIRKNAIIIIDKHHVNHKVMVFSNVAVFISSPKVKVWHPVPVVACQ